jgi:transcriptional regulator with XRE-family HTH domain
MEMPYYCFMKVRKELIEGWIEAHRPYGLDKLSRAAEISSGSLQKIRQGRSLVNPHARERLAKALGVKESELSPATTGKSRAS